MRITGPVDLNADVRRRHSLGSWGGTTTASSSFAATGHTLTNSMTSTMGSEIVSVGIQPVFPNTLLDIETQLNVGATGGTFVFGLFYGTASHPFDAFLESYAASADRSSALAFTSLYAVTGTATANVSVRMASSASITLYVNSNPGGGSLGGALKSALRVIERQS